MATNPTSQDSGREESATFQIEVSSPELQVYSTETRIEEVLPDGTRRALAYTDELTIRRGRRIRVGINLPRWMVYATLVLLAIVIGLITVGPGEVWVWLTKVIDRLIN